nr:aldo/keto reductase [Maliibacterium massiliense]
MRTIPITDQLHMTEIVMGIERLGLFATKQDCFTLIERYLEAGGNCIDTARLYADGETDKVLGAWIKQTGRREDILISAKGCHNAPGGVPRLTPEIMRQDLDDALRDLSTDHVDIFYLHRDNIQVPVSEIMPTVDALVKSGKTRAMGVSNWTAARIAEANDFARKNNLTPFVASQILNCLAVTTPAATGDLTHIAMNDVERGWYEETRFPVVSYSAQAKGYFIKYFTGEAVRPFARRSFDHFPENHRRAQRVKKLADDLGTSIAAVGLAYVLQNGLNALAVITVSKLAQLDGTFDALKLHLSPEQIRYLETGK